MDTSMIVDVDDESNGSASMSDSGSEEEDEGYEPAGPSVPVSTQQSDEDSDEYDPEEAPVQDLTPAPDHDVEAGEIYEPSESLQVDEEAQISPGAVEEPSRGASAAASVVSAVPEDIREDDVESGPQLTEANTLVVKPQTPLDGSAEGDQAQRGSLPSSTRFVPYQTPLRAFKTYRFHSDFNDTVEGGYRSLTYSNSIDPVRPLCPTELSGESCTDPSCQEQHFRQIGLPGKFEKTELLIVVY